MPPLKILLIDDHCLFREGLRLLLARETAEFVVTAEAHDGATALARALEAQPDLIIMDVHLGSEDGIAIAAHIAERLPAAKIIFLSSDPDIQLVRRAVDLGAKAYLLKEHASEELLRALRAAPEGGVYLCPLLADALLASYRQRDTATTSAQPDTTPLSDRELTVLRLIAEGLRNKEIADRLAISQKSVETYRSRLIKKLGYDSTAELVRHAIRIGLIKP